jgi:hypothetical protein
MFEWLKGLSFQVVLAIVGFLLIIAGFFQISDITKFNITVHPEPIYTVVVLGIASLVVSIWLFRAERSRVQLPKDLDDKPKLVPKSIFLSAPMNMFKVSGRPEDYKESRTQVLKIIATIKLECGINDTYYAGENIESVDQFDLPGASLQKDFRRIQEREYFILFWPEKITSRSSLVEAGVALTLNKKCIYFVRSQEDLPFLLQGAQNCTKNVKIVKFTDIDNLVNILKVNGNSIFDFTDIR